MTTRRFVMFFSLSFAALVGCSHSSNPWENQPGPPRVVVSIPPLYSFVKAVGGDHVGVICLCTKTGPHEYQYNPHDAIAARQADLLLGIGLGLDEKFMNEIKENSGNPKLKYVELAEAETTNSKGEKVSRFKDLLEPMKGHDHADH